MPNLTIVGAGVAGLALAARLSQKAQSVSLLEARPAQESRGGAALAMAPNAMWVLRRLGLADRVTEAGSRIRRYHFWDFRGRSLKIVPMDPLSAPWGESAWCVPRAHLLQSLQSAAEHAAIRHHAAVSTVQVDGAQFRIALSDGCMLSTDALVGADGAHSVVRRALWNDASPVYRGFVAARGTMHQAVDPAFSDSVVQIWGPGGEFGFAPMGSGRLYWFATMAWPDSSVLPDRAALLRHFHHWCHPVVSLITATPESALLVHPIFDRLSPFAELPMAATLIGDAAHLMTPNTGQGACQSLLDAWVLAESWSTADTPLDAFHTYRHQRLAPALKVARLSRQLGRTIHHPAYALRTIRDALIATLPASVLRRGMASVVGNPQGLE